jgi:hypothetical protein
MSVRSERVLIACAVAALLGLVLTEGFAGDGDSPRVIAGWIMVVGAVLAAIVAALLGDRSNPLGSSGEGHRLQGPGVVSFGLSGALAVLMMISLLNDLSPRACDRAFTTGIGPETRPGLSSTRAGELRGFPPGRVCRMYGIPKAAPSGTVTPSLVAERTVPTSTGYVLGLLVVLAPMLISAGWRTVAQRPAGRASGPVDGVDRA